MSDKYNVHPGINQSVQRTKKPPEFFGQECVPFSIAPALYAGLVVSGTKELHAEAFGPVRGIEYGGFETVLLGLEPFYGIKNVLP